MLKIAEGLGFEILLTMDRGLEYTQSLAGRKIALVILCARSNRLNDLLPLVDDVLEKIMTIEAGQIIRVGQ